MIRYIVGMIAWLAIMLAGYYLLHIRPSLAEMVLVTVACTLSTGVNEALR